MYRPAAVSLRWFIIRGAGMAADVAATAAKIVTNMEKVIIGKRPQLALALSAYLCEGHILLEDVPGVA